MDLTLVDRDANSFLAGYSCPCGCTPSIEYARGAGVVSEGCCCGNHFAVGPGAALTMQPKAGFRPELQMFDAPWGDRLEAAWSIGPSVHAPSDDHDHHGEAADTRTIDPVCGMTVDPAVAEANGLHVSYNGVDHLFCGKGCKLEFGDDPERFLDPSYIPSM